MKKWKTYQMVYDTQTGEYVQSNGPVIEAETSDEAEKTAIKRGCVVVEEC